MANLMVYDPYRYIMVSTAAADRGDARSTDAGAGGKVYRRRGNALVKHHCNRHQKRAKEPVLYFGTQSSECSLELLRYTR